MAVFVCMRHLWLLLLVMSRMSSSVRVVSLILQDPFVQSLRNQLHMFPPSLGSDSHKGQAGRVAVIGGSKDYTGAPYYAAAASLRFGGDLSYVFCEKSASLAIKSYSPELMVSPLYVYEDLEGPQFPCNVLLDAVLGMLPRLHSLVVGPGMGRDVKVFAIVQSIIEAAVEAGIPVVIDADGLYMLETSPDLWPVILGHAKKVYITPNKAEFDRLCKRASGSSLFFCNRGLW